MKTSFIRCNCSRQWGFVVLLTVIATASATSGQAQATVGATTRVIRHGTWRTSIIEALKVDPCRADLPHVTLSTTADMPRLLNLLGAQYALGVCARLPRGYAERKSFHFAGTPLWQVMDQVAAAWGCAWSRCTVFGTSGDAGEAMQKGDVVVFRPLRDPADDLPLAQAPEQVPAVDMLSRQGYGRLSVSATVVRLSMLLNAISWPTENGGYENRPADTASVLWSVSDALANVPMTLYCTATGGDTLSAAIEVATGGYWVGQPDMQSLRALPLNWVQKARETAQSPKWRAMVTDRAKREQRETANVLKEILCDEVLKGLSYSEGRLLADGQIIKRPVVDLSGHAAAAYVALCDLHGESWFGKVDLSAVDRSIVEIVPPQAAALAGAASQAPFRTVITFSTR